MTKATLRAAAIGGILGGVMMSVWLMFVLWLTGAGFWTLLNLITNTFWRSAPLGPKFDLAAVFIGLVVHVLMSLLFGSLIAYAAWWLPGPRSLIVAGGALFGPVLWVVMQFGIWRAVDPAAAQVITPWVFAVAHLIYGVLAAAAAAIITSDEKTRSSRVEAAEEQALPDAGSFADRSADRAVAASAHRPAVPGAQRQPVLGVNRHAPGSATRPASEDVRYLPGVTPDSPPVSATARGNGAAWHRRPLTARNDAGMRTTIYTSGGPGMVTDEPVKSGGTGSALTPLETVLGALCGSTGATFATVAREAGFRYDGLNFEASFAAGPRGLPAQPGMRPYFHAVRVEIKVRAPRADPRLADVAQLTERRCAVRNLLADAGVTVDLTWHAVAPETPAPETPAPGTKAPETPQAPGVHRRPASWS
jgi:uncharacterized OsmC-like protein